MIDGVYKIRSWESMENEYGVDKRCVLSIRLDGFLFVPNMAINCNKKIRIIGDRYENYYYSLQMTVPERNANHEQIN